MQNDDLDINKIAAELAAQLTSSVFGKLKIIGQSVSDSIKVKYNLCFQNYIESNYPRLSKTKTLLYRDIPVDIHKFYVRTNLKGKNGEAFDRTEIYNILEDNKRVVISGTAGCGKSTFCKSIFIELVEKPKGFFPIFIELRHLNTEVNVTLLDYILSSLKEAESTFNENQLNQSLEIGKVLLIFDGFDEIHADLKLKHEKELLKLALKYSDLRILVSSRPDDRFSSWENFSQFSVLPLDRDKAIELVQKLDYDPQVKDKFLTELEGHLFNQHQSFAENPLLLTMMLLTYEQFAEIPNKIHLFYEQAFHTLFNKHDSLKSLYKRSTSTGLPVDEFRKLLAAFCVLSYADRKYFFSEDEALSYIGKAQKISGIKIKRNEFFQDLLDCVCILQRDGLGYTFTHRSFQEFFCALFLVNFVSEKQYELIDKISFINELDDVIPMAHDMNSDLIEQSWMIPNLKAVRSRFPSLPKTHEEVFELISTFFDGIVFIEESGRKRIGFLHISQGGSKDLTFIRYILRIYSNDLDKLLKPREKPTQELIDEVIRLYCKNESRSILFKELKTKAARSRIAMLGVHLFLVRSIKFSYDTLDQLESKYATKQSSISSLLLASKKKSKKSIT